LDILIAITARNWYHTAPEAYQTIIVGRYVITKIKTEAFLARSIVQFNQLTLPPNQSLKLTEPAVDDLARAKQPVTIDRTYLARTGFRRCGTSLPQLSSGPLGGEDKTFGGTLKLSTVQKLSFLVLTPYIVGWSPVDSSYDDYSVGVGGGQYATYDCEGNAHPNSFADAGVKVTHKLKHRSELA